MFVAGIDRHATYSVVAMVSNARELVQKPACSAKTSSA